MALSVLCLLSACASRQPDHFYILSPQPQSAGERTTTPPTPVSLRVSLPSLVDRSEMVLNTSADGVTVLEHERWAAPLADLVTQALAEDMERRRSDLLVAGPSSAHSATAAFKVTVDIVQMTAGRDGRVSIATHWRVLDARTTEESAGGDEFSAPLAQDGYAAVAHALSECLALLADRLVAQMPHPAS
jgi:uncharacterized protein